MPHDMLPDRDPLDLEAIDRAVRINETKERLREMGMQDMHTNSDCPPEIEESFLSSIELYETVPISTQLEQLKRDGVPVPEPASLDDAALHEALWRIIHALAARCVYLQRTDHLSDRELYTHLFEDSLREEVPIMPKGSGWNNYIDIIGGCSEEDLQINLRFYEDDDGRARWAEEFPEDHIPPREAPPFDRDRLLPKSDTQLDDMRFEQEDELDDSVDFDDEPDPDTKDPH